MLERELEREREREREPCTRVRGSRGLPRAHPRRPAAGAARPATRSPVQVLRIGVAVERPLRRDQDCPGMECVERVRQQADVRRATQAAAGGAGGGSGGRSRSGSASASINAPQSSSSKKSPTMSSAFDPGMAARQTCRPRTRGEESPVRGRLSASWAEGDLEALGGALESLFDARSGDDVLAVAEAEGRLQRALFVPEVVEMITQALQLGGRGRVVPLREDVPQFGAPLALRLDLLVNLSQGHVLDNAGRAPLIPAAR